MRYRWCRGTWKIQNEPRKERRAVNKVHIKIFSDNQKLIFSDFSIKANVVGAY